MALKSGMCTIAGRASLQGISSRSSYVCLQCRRYASDTALKTNQSPRIPSITRRHASTSSFSERIRKKIWGTDEPPGQENPYGSPGVFEQKRKEKGIQDPEEKSLGTETMQPPQPADNSLNQETPFTGKVSEVTTWEGMPVVGNRKWGLGGWEAQHYPFEGFDFKIIPRRVRTDTKIQVHGQPRSWKWRGNNLYRPSRPRGGHDIERGKPTTTVE